MLRPGPAAQRNEHLEMGVSGLQDLELLKIPTQCTIRNSDAVDAFGGRPGLLIVRPRIAEPTDDLRALFRGSDVTEGIVEMSQKRCRSARHDALDRIGPVIDAPGRKIPDDLGLRRC